MEMCLSQRLHIVLSKCLYIHYHNDYLTILHFLIDVIILTRKIKPLKLVRPFDVRHPMMVAYPQSRSARVCCYGLRRGTKNKVYDRKE